MFFNIVMNSRNALKNCNWILKGYFSTSQAAYKDCMESGTWQKQVEVGGDFPGQVILSSPHSIHHYNTSLPSSFPTSVSIAVSDHLILFALLLIWAVISRLGFS